MVDGLREWSSAADIAGWGKRDLEEGWKMRSQFGPF